MAAFRLACTTGVLLLWQTAIVVSGPLPLPLPLPAASANQPQVVLDKPPLPAPAAPAAGPRKLQGKFLHITDLHPDEFYKVHSSTDEEAACHRGDGPAGTYGAETSDCDTPFSLINATFDWIAENIADDIDFVIWTGDSARHDSDERIPRSPAQVLGTNRWIADKFAEVFANPEGPKALAVPVIPTLGNNDILPHNILLPGPNKWLQYYTDIWKNFIPEEQRHSFEFGGWFYVEVIPHKLAVFSLNTLYFFDRNAGVDDCAQPSEPGFKQMEWLRIQLQFMRLRGMKAIMMGHVPPARTDSKQLWDETCWQKYTLWLQQYRDVVIGGTYGHMNIDHFLIQDTKQINLDTADAEAETMSLVREAMEGELSVASTAEYLQELRDGWSKLPRPVLYAEDMGELKKKKKKKNKGKNGKKHKKKLGGRWAERYQLSLISPSIVPNYFPTLRVVEYNISGLENAIPWAASTEQLPITEDSSSLDISGDQMPLELRSLEDADFGALKKKQEKKKGKKPESDKKKGGKDKDPNLIVPDPPAKSSPPGPAYSPQPLTFTGYTQYYANLTHINNDYKSLGTGPQNNRWQDGKHRDKKPPQKPAKPRTFKFEVEYTTFDDKLYNLTDLTVNSFIDLAFRMGQRQSKSKAIIEESETMGEVVDDEITDDEFMMDMFEEELEEADEDGEVDTQGKGGKKGKKGGKKKKKRHNKVWLHFLQHAFVGTVDDNELKKLS